MNKLTYVTCVLALTAAPSFAETTGGIKMLPPVQSDNMEKNCFSGAGSKLLSWDGERPIICNKDIVVDENGRVGIGTSLPTQPLTVVNPSGLYGSPIR